MLTSRKRRFVEDTCNLGQYPSDGGCVNCPEGTYGPDGKGKYQNKPLVFV